MYVFKANTTNRPNKLISDYLNAGVTNPSHVNAEIWPTLKKRYGSDSQVFYELLQNLKSFKKIDTPEGIYRVARKKVSDFPRS